jgi:biotin carboxyl carrier protein
MRGHRPTASTSAWEAPERLATEPSEAQTVWATGQRASVEPATSYWQGHADAEPATHYWQGDAEPATHYWSAPEEEATHFRGADSYAQPSYEQSYAPPHYQQPSYEQSYQQPAYAPHYAPPHYSPAPQVASPRAETFLSAVQGGVGRPAAIAVAASAPPPPMTLDGDRGRRAGASSRKAARPAPSRAPSHLAEEASRSAHGGRSAHSVSRARPSAPSPAAATPAEARGRAIAGEMAAKSQAAPARQASQSVYTSAAAKAYVEELSRSVFSHAAPGGSDHGGDGPSRSRSLAPAAPAPPPGPLRIEAPPEVVHAAYPLVRRIALQQDLKSGDRILRVGLSELTNSTTCRTWFVGADGERFSLELDADLTDTEKALLDQAQAALQPRAGGRLLVVPLIAANKVLALALLCRGDHLAAFAPPELMIAMVVMQEMSGLFVQLLHHHAQGQRDAANDAKSIYNAEALASQRKRGHEGGLIHLSPRWVRIAYPAAVLAVVIGIAFAILAKVPTYSAGAGVVTIEGVEVTSPTTGTVAAVRVKQGQPVAAGEELARLLSQDEESALQQADREYRNALATLLFDGADETTKAAVAAAATARQRAEDRLEAKVIRAPREGVVGDIRVRGGAALAQGDHVLTLLRQDAEPTVLVFLPGQDRPRLRRGQKIQIELAGYTKVRERGTIVEVGAEVIGPNEARRSLGQKNADAVPLNGPVVMVRATLPTRTFKVKLDTFRYHDGMPLRGEVKVEDKPFLISLIPALEKAL